MEYLYCTSIHSVLTPFSRTVTDPVTILELLVIDDYSVGDRQRGPLTLTCRERGEGDGRG